MKKEFLLFMLALFFFTTTGIFSKGEKQQPTDPTKIIYDIAYMDTNNVDLPLVNNGSTANDGNAFYPNGTNLIFLFSGGLATTGFISGDFRASWMAPSSLIEEWQAGVWGMDPQDPLAKFYEVSADDGPGSPAYVEWADAVALGADFIDVNGDGLYDPNVDRPALLGDKTIWTPFNDGTPLSQRIPRLGTPQMGMEIQQTAWAYNRGGPLDDVVFFHYKIINKDSGAVDSLIFSIWTDSDIGDFADDLVGSDTTLSLGYNYNDGSDPTYGVNPPAFGVQFLQGATVDSPGDTAFVYRGANQGVDTLLNKRNLPMTSFMHYINGDPTIGDPNNAQIARNYQIGGLDADGIPIDPTVWGIGGTSTTNPKFFYSGDPVAGTGWRDDMPDDKRFLVNNGPFNLALGDTQNIVCAYVLGQGNDALSSITEMRQNASFIDNFFPYGRLVRIVADKSFISLDSIFVFTAAPFSLVYTDTLQSASWQLIDQPPGSVAQIAPGPDFQATLDPDIAGDYTVRLEGVIAGQSLADTLTVQAVQSNPPLAQLSIVPSTFVYGDNALADGSASSDPNGDPLSFNWTFPNWAATNFLDSSRVEFTPSHTGSGEIEMRVSDPFFTVQKADSFVVTPLMQNLQTNLHFPGHTDAIQMEYFHGKIVILESFLLNLRIFDPGDPGNYSSHIFFGNPRKFTTDGMRLAAFGGTMDSLELYTVDNNVNLNLASKIDVEVLPTASLPADVYFNSDNLFVPNLSPKELQVYDISDPNQPSQVSVYPLPPLTGDMAFDGNVAAFYDRHPATGGLITLNIFDPNNIIAVDTLDVAIGERNVEMGGNKIYLLNGLVEGSEVLVIDASQPGNLQLADTISIDPVLPGGSSVPINTMNAQGDRLLLGLKDGVKVYDTADPYNVVEIAQRHSGFNIEATAWNDPQLFIVEQGDIEFGAGYYSFDQVVGIDDEKPVSNLPQQFQLMQNYPNPFNPETTIRYHLPEAIPVKLSIYNMLGQKIKTLVDAKQTAGEYRIRWNGRDESGREVASGIYLYRLKAGDFVSTKKMLLLQ